MSKMTDVPKTYQRIWEKARTGKSLKSAAKCFCLECVGWLRVEVERCSSPNCPLFRYRPYMTDEERAHHKTLTKRRGVGGFKRKSTHSMGKAV